MDNLPLAELADSTLTLARALVEAFDGALVDSNVGEIGTSLCGRSGLGDCWRWAHVLALDGVELADRWCDRWYGWYPWALVMACRRIEGAHGELGSGQSHDDGGEAAQGSKDGRNLHVDK